MTLGKQAGKPMQNKLQYRSWTIPVTNSSFLNASLNG